MIQRERTVAAGEFEAKCLALLDEVASTGIPLVVTKRGCALVRIEPVDHVKPKSLRGSIVWEGDSVSPIAEKSIVDA